MITVPVQRPHPQGVSLAHLGLLAQAQGPGLGAGPGVAVHRPPRNVVARQAGVMAPSNLLLVAARGAQSLEPASTSVRLTWLLHTECPASVTAGAL